MLFPGAHAASLTLSWNDNADNEAGFIVERKTGQGAWSAIAQTPADAETYTDAAVEYDTLYTYRVKAYNSAGESGYTNEATGQVKSAIVITPPPVIVPPDSPSGFTVTVSVEVQPRQ